MLPFTLVTEFGKPCALILEDNPAPRQLTTLFALLPEHAQSSPALAARWDAAHVLCTRDWASEQLHRRPMLRPQGAKLAFVSI